VDGSLAQFETKAIAHNYYASNSHCRARVGQAPMFEYIVQIIIVLGVRIALIF